MKAGSLIAIMGPSGCGKSTLLKTLNGESPATKGIVKIFDFELEANYDFLSRNYDGMYKEDYQYIKGLEDLDECNGMVYDGTNGYCVTDSFPG